MRVCLLPLTFLAALANGQSSVSSDSLLQAIVGAKVEVGNGQMVENGTILIKNGVITGVGSNLKVPPGYEILDGKGLTVYPGFIDAYTTKGIKLPESQPKLDNPPNTSDYAPAMMREANRKGISPEVHAAQYLDLSEDLRKSYWNAGFTTAMVVPGAGNLAGYGALVNLGGRPNRDSVVVLDTGLDCGLSRSPAGPDYPGTALGYIAQARQTFLDAQWYSQLTAAFKAGGYQRPPADLSLQALQPVLARSYPVFFDADSKKWMERSLMIADEFSLKPILVEAKQAWKLADRIKKDGIPVIVGFGFGKEPSPSPTVPTPSTPSPANEKLPTQNAVVPKMDDDAEPKEQVQDRQRLYREQLSNPIVLHKASIHFSFTTKSSKDMDEFWSDLRRAVKDGLPREVALQSLTVEPAKLYGVERQLGTIETGKTANLAVLTGDFLDSKTKTKMIYIDGRKIDPSKGIASGAPRRFFGDDL